MMGRSVEIPYQSFTFSIRLQRRVRFDVYPTFVFRSILGKELRRMSCPFSGKKKCDVCGLKNQCVYSQLFESPIEKDTGFLEGRNRGIHPFTLYSSTGLNVKTNQLSLVFTLVGKNVLNFPYVYKALINGGKAGVLKDRVPFSIEDVTVDGLSVIDADGSLKDNSSKCWSFQNRKSPSVSGCCIELCSPVRLKAGGRFVSAIVYSQLLASIQRRVNVIGPLYVPGWHGEVQWDVPERQVKNRVHWLDLPHFSARQRKLILMGGLVGTAEIGEEITTREFSLLKAGEIFHVGKNPGFGLGKIMVRQYKISK